MKLVLALISTLALGTAFAADAPKAAAPAAAPAVAAPAAAPAAATASSADDAHHKVLSPIVGTFYRAPSPDADAFVQVGQHAHQLLLVGRNLAHHRALQVDAQVGAGG